jgi:hypothetical protein
MKTGNLSFLDEIDKLKKFDSQFIIKYYDDFMESHLSCLVIEFSMVLH